MAFGELAEMLDEQLAREERCDADREHTAAAEPLLEAGGDVVELLQEGFDLAAQLPAQVRQRERARAALEQRALQALFERLDLMAHGRRRHAELRGGRLEAQVASRGAKRPQAANRAFAQRRSSSLGTPSRR